MKDLHRKLLKNISPMEVLKISEGHSSVCTWLVGKVLIDLTDCQAQSMADELESTVMSWDVLSLDEARGKLRTALGL